MNESNNRIYLVISHTITILFLIQIILSFLFYNWAGIVLLAYAGWMIIITGVIIFSKALVDFRKVKKTGNENKELVDTGIFSVIRHPMYLSFILIAIGLISISQYWLVIIIGLTRIIMLYYVMIEEEKMDLEKFGNDYKEYLERVPRLNIINGIKQKMYKKKV